MFVWRKRAGAVWLAANEAPLCEIGGRRLAIISRPDRKSAIAEIVGSSRRNLEKIRSRFGGTIEKLPRDWLKEFSRSQKSEPIKIGNRLVIYRSVTSKNRSRNKSLLIPAGRAFGTGEHPTTAMSLRLLERCTRFWGVQAGSLRSPELRNHARCGPACLRFDGDHRDGVMLGMTQTDPCGFHRTLFGERLRSAV